MANLKYIRGLSGRGFRVKNNTGARVTCKEGVNVQVDLDDVETQDILSRERDNFVRVAGSGNTTAVLKPLTRRGIRLTPRSSTVTITEATPGVVTFTAHGLKTGDALVFSTDDTLPANLVAGTVYYVSSTTPTVNTFKVSTTLANALAGTNISTAGGSAAGNHAAAPVVKNVGVDSDVTVDLNDGRIKKFLKRNFGRFMMIDSAGNVVQDIVGIQDIQASFRVEDPVLTFVFAGANNDLTFTPKTPDGEIVTVELIDPGTNETPISAAVVGSTGIEVELDITQNVQATAVLTATGGPALDGETVTVGTQVYTLKTTLTPTVGEVLLGAAVANTLDNLKSAVNLTGTPGTDYAAGLVKNTQAIATTNTDTEQTFEAIPVGTAGNAVAKAETSGTILDFDGVGAVFTGGVDELVRSTAADVKTEIEATSAANDLVVVAFEGSGAGLVAPIGPEALGADPEGVGRGEAVNAVDLTDSFNIGQLRRRFKAWVEN